MFAGKAELELETNALTRYGIGADKTQAEEAKGGTRRIDEVSIAHTREKMGKKE